MNLSNLFQMQKSLDDHIYKEHQLEGKHLLGKKKLALIVELGELANEWQGFKYWKVNPETKPGMLEEYVDCLHFVLSIGLEIEKINGENVENIDYWSFQSPFGILNSFSMLITDCWNLSDISYGQFFCEFLGLGEMLGFSWEQIEEAYFAKNAVNHKRQEQGY